MMMFTTSFCFGQKDSTSVNVPNLDRLFRISILDGYKKSPSPLSLSTRYDHNLFPIFCKIEHKMSLNAKIPIRIRLGSVDYVDKLEGKRN